MARRPGIRSPGSGEKVDGFFDAYARLIEEDLESITADYEASPRHLCGKPGRPPVKCWPRPAAWSGSSKKGGPYAAVPPETYAAARRRLSRC